MEGSGVPAAYLKWGTLVFKETKGRGNPDCGKQVLAPRTSYLFAMFSIFLPPHHRERPVLVLSVKRFPGAGNVPLQKPAV